MIGSAAFYRLMRGEIAGLDLNACPIAEIGLKSCFESGIELKSQRIVGENPAVHWLFDALGNCEKPQNCGGNGWRISVIQSIDSAWECGFKAAETAKDMPYTASDAPRIQQARANAGKRIG